MSDFEEINDESEHQCECVGYYTRSKRRKLENDEEEATCTIRKSTERKRKNPIMAMPVEIVQAIFQYISNAELSQNVRLVNRRFKIIAEDILNRSFKKIEKQLVTFNKTIDISLAYSQNDMEIKCISKLKYMLEILHMQALPTDVLKIIYLSKMFCIHFDKVREEPIQNSFVYSGCKMVDIIDCARFIEKKTNWETSTNDTFSAQYSYFFRNCWFVALPIKATKEMDSSQKQRMMQMRLRRLVLAHNDFFLAQDLYERELILRPSAEHSLKRPGNNVYTGYGDGSDTFFYYGVMNEGAFIQNFNVQNDNDEEEIDEQNNEPEPNIDLARNNSEEDIVYRLSHLGFELTVTVQCPLSYAPLKYLEKLEEEKLQKLKSKHRTKVLTNIKLVFECLGAIYPRLPSIYQYDFLPNRF